MYYMTITVPVLRVPKFCKHELKINLNQFPSQVPVSNLWIFVHLYRCIQPCPKLPLLPPIQPIHASKCLTRHLQQPPLVKQLLVARLVYIAVCVCDAVQKQRKFEMSVEPPKRKETTSSLAKKVDFEDHSLGFPPQITSPPPFLGGFIS